ncbi:MAG TPA: hypothetical protein VMM12_09640 [Longimicrobiales bacterium]|nr:hypothetical protein [Longimicrobiales bacterium]
MIRLFLAILLILLLSVSVPPLRSRAMPKYRALGSWVWGYLEGPVSPAFNPWRRMKTRAEMAKIANQLIVLRNRGYPPPTQADLPAFVFRAAEDSTATDAWGSPYQIEIGRDSIYLRSWGADLEPGTEDDILLGVRFESRQRRGILGR